MRKIILIGNGFDLAHNMETSYMHFLLWYLNKVNDSWNNSFYDDKFITMKCNNVSISKLTAKIEHVRDFLSYVDNNHIQLTFKCDLFIRIIKNAIYYKWVDIERIYFEELLRLYKIIEKVNFHEHNEILKIVNNLNNCFEQLKLKFIEYLGEKTKELPFPNEEIAQHLKNITIDGVIGNEINEVFVINFNYTSTIDIYKEIFKESKFKVLNIHGKLNEEGNPIIFGYGDEADTYYQKIEAINNNEFLKHFKSFYYLKTSNYRTFERYLTCPGFDVYIMGHSCGISDKVLLSTLFEDKRCHRIKIFYHQKSETENDYFEKTQEISRHFKAENKGRMRTIIVPEEKCVPLVSFKPEGKII
ncbi:MAG TPA: hypothetical protein DCQ26_00355 [Marinilabiliales bacterium]|nr:hypothetical protein [Marinilabiliales bacterium]HBX86093.1 hypothetical protein [Marinilabiliales bacterium]